MMNTFLNGTTLFVRLTFFVLLIWNLPIALGLVDDKKGVSSPNAFVSCDNNQPQKTCSSCFIYDLHGRFGAFLKKIPQNMKDDQNSSFSILQVKAASYLIGAGILSIFGKYV